MRSRYSNMVYDSTTTILMRMSVVVTRMYARMRAALWTRVRVYLRRRRKRAHGWAAANDATLLFETIVIFAIELLLLYVHSVPPV